ncbi:MAG: creatininase family protein, partial [Acetobacteraceae bacterium]|nr:creatininase family protein [Acetobacteraceae bacterium]
VLSNSHGGNENALRTLTDELTVKLRVPIIQFSYPYAARPEIAALLTTQDGVRHACEAETAMMLALRPELVAGARIPPRDAPSSPESGLYRWRSFAVRTETGVRGNPDAGTAEQGERLVAAITEALAAKLADPALWHAAFLPDAPPSATPATTEGRSHV